MHEGFQFIKYLDRADEWRWQFRAVGNSEPIADSGEGYKDERDCDYGIELVKRYGPTAPVVPGHLT
jgi:uncharacterized protein YegP (UPF0339 family)